MYDPAVGRFTGADPIGLAGGLNLYVYCGNDPVNSRDPFGLDDGERNGEPRRTFADDFGWSLVRAFLSGSTFLEWVSRLSPLAPTPPELEQREPVVVRVAPAPTAEEGPRLDPADFRDLQLLAIRKGHYSLAQYAGLRARETTQDALRLLQAAAMAGGALPPGPPGSSAAGAEGTLVRAALSESPGLIAAREGAQVAELGLETTGRGAAFERWAATIARRLDRTANFGAQHVVEGMATPTSPRAYSVIFEVELTAEQAASRSRALHFRVGNEALLRATDANPEFRSLIEALVPGFERARGSRVPVLPVSPAEFVTWHHVPNSNKLQLIWRYQHELGNPFAPEGSPWRVLLHPEGVGGFAQGAR